MLAKTVFAFLVVAVAALKVQAAELITPSNIVCSTAGTDFFPVVNLRNGSGLTGTPTLANLGTHDLATATNSWVTRQQAGDYYPGFPAPVLTCTLPQLTEVSELVVWGYNLGTPNGNEAKTFVVTFSTNGSTFIDPVTVTQPTVLGGAAVRLPFPASRFATHVRVTITDNHFGDVAVGGDRVGLGELRFAGVPQTVELVGPTAITSAQVVNDYPLINLINGSGLSGAPTLAALGSHATINSSNAWRTDSDGSPYFDGHSAPQLTCTLPQLSRLTELVLWGYNDGGLSGDEAKNFIVSFSTDGTVFTDPVTVTSPIPLGATATRLPFPTPHDATHVRLTITTNQAPSASGGERVGLGELRFVRVINRQTVTTLADEFDTPSGGAVSLREAIRDAAATAGAATIDFAPGLTGLMTVGSPLVLASDVSIDASALPGGVSISGANATRIFAVGAGRTITLRALHLSAGNAGASGGAIINAGTLTVMDSDVTSSAGAIDNSGQLTLLRCTLSGNVAQDGGAISNTGTATLTDCTLSGNLSGTGGAIFNAGTLSLLRCTVAGNFANDFAGAIYQGSGALTLRHVTLAGNSSGFQGGGITINAGTMSVAYSIVAGNGAPDSTGRDVRNNGTITRVGANLIQTAIDFGAGSSSGPDALSAPPQVGPLASYGGATPTCALQPASPARNAAVGSTATVDQRGFPMVGIADLGAYEAGTLTNFAAWSTETTGNLFAFDADPDGDGNPAGLEYALGGSAAVPSGALFPVPARVLLPGNVPAVSFSFPYRPLANDLRYLLERRTDLADAAPWQTVLTFVPNGAQLVLTPGVVPTFNAGASSVTITDTNLASPRTFWRLRVEPVP